jgi:ketosteroid isomerase-like protein
MDTVPVDWLQAAREAWGSVDDDAGDDRAGAGFRVTAEIVPAGDRTLVLVTETGEGRPSGTSSPRRYFFVWRFCEGRMVGRKAFADEGDAHVEQLHGLFDAWSTGDFEVGEALFAPDIEFITSEGWPETPTSGSGMPGLQRWRDLFLSSFQDLRIEAEDLSAEGDRVVVRVRQRGTFRATGIAMDITYWQAWWFRGGRVARWQAFEHEGDARAAVGIDHA